MYLGQLGQHYLFIRNALPKQYVVAKTCTPIIMTEIDILRAQSLPTRLARVPPTNSCARPGMC